MAGISDDVENLRVNRGDFMNALEEVHPAFGVSEEELLQVIQNGIIHYDGVVDVGHFFPCGVAFHPVFTGAPADWPTVRRASSLIYAHSARQHPPSWSARIR